MKVRLFPILSPFARCFYERKQYCFWNVTVTVWTGLGTGLGTGNVLAGEILRHLLGITKLDKEKKPKY
jgi:hypothetical protein